MRSRKQVALWQFEHDCEFMHIFSGDGLLIFYLGAVISRRFNVLSMTRLKVGTQIVRDYNTSKIHFFYLFFINDVFACTNGLKLKSFFVSVSIIVGIP